MADLTSDSPTYLSSERYVTERFGRRRLIIRATGQPPAALSFDQRMKLGNISITCIYVCNLCLIVCSHEWLCFRKTEGFVDFLQRDFSRDGYFRMCLRGGRSKRGGKRVKAALEDAHQRGSNSTAGARFPIGKWANPPNVTLNKTKNFPDRGPNTMQTPWKKSKPLSNRQLANQARSRHR